MFTELHLDEYLSSVVDCEFYQSKYKDVNLLGWSPQYHFHKYGKKINRNKSDFITKSVVDYNTKKRDLINIGIASMPSREKKLEVVLDSVSDQVDNVYLFLNNYEVIPDFIQRFTNITVFRSQEFGDLRDNGKFFGLKYISEDSYYVTLDDDINYPKEYISEIISKIDFYDKKCVVGLHGVIYGKLAGRFFDRKAFHFSREVLFDTPVSLLGTGTTGFYKKNVPLTLNDFLTTGKADLYLSAFLKRHKIPAICIARNENWLKEIDEIVIKDNKNIFQETKKNTAPYDNVIRTNSPWGYSKIQESIVSAGVLSKSAGFKLIEVLSQIERDEVFSLDYEDARLLVSYLPLMKSKKLARLVFSSIVNKQFSIFLLKKNIDPSFEKMYEISKKMYKLKGESSIVKSYKKDVSINTSDLEKNLVELGLYKEVTKLNIIRYCRGEVSALKLANTAYISADSFVLKYLANIFSDKSKLLKNNDLVEMLWIYARLGLNEEYQLLRDIVSKREIEGLVVYKSDIYNGVDNDDFKKVESSLLSLLNAKHKKKDKHVNETLQYLIGCNFSFKIQDESRWLEALNENNKYQVALIYAYIVKNTNFEIINKTLIDIFSSSNDVNSQGIRSALNFKEKKSFSHAIEFYNKNSKLPTVDLDIENESKYNSFFRFLCSGYVAKDVRAVNEEKLISVIIATFNDKDTLQYAYDSIVNQTYSNIEIIIVDDCGECSPQEFLITSHSVETKFIKNIKNSGPYVSRNNGMKVAKGEIISFHDADDWAHPNKISNQVAVLLSKNNECCVAVYDRHARVDACGLIMPENNMQYLGDGPITGIFKKAVFENIGVFLNVRSRGDIEFKNRIINGYGHECLINQEAVSVLALDWMSNSKKYNFLYSETARLRDMKVSFNSRVEFLKFG